MPERRKTELYHWPIGIDIPYGYRNDLKENRCGENEKRGGVLDGSEKNWSARISRRRSEIYKKTRPAIPSKLLHSDARCPFVLYSCKLSKMHCSLSAARNPVVVIAGSY